jgi:signal transduction histidine kinase/CheY-like chemotaxis protein/HPt (histidine-containing phosphotransfer) domain-containing protein
MKATTTYDRRPDRCSSGKLFRVLAGTSAMLQIASLYVVLTRLTSESPDLGPLASYVPEHARPYIIVVPGIANLLILVAIGFWFGRFMNRRVREERLLRESEQFARATVDALPAHIAILDNNGAVLATNRAWREFAKANGDDGKLIRETVNYLAECDALAGKHLTEAAALANGIRSVIAGHSEVFLMEYDCHVPARDEKGRPRYAEPPAIRRWFSGRVTRFPDAGRSAAKVVVAHDDITARKLAEEQVHQAKETAELANLSKSQFLANTSHEIRTPMTAILGYAEMLLDTKQTADERTACAKTIRRNGEHLLAIINDILDISKIEAQKVTVEKLQCDLPQLVADVVGLTRAWVAKKGLEFEIVFDKLIPKHIVTDPLRAKQVLVNLVSNAIKFTHKGKIRLSINREITYFTHVIRFEVTDTGIGMTPDQVGRLFQPFTQADASTTRKYGGTGLGLTISKRLSNLLGGDIHVSSEPGTGSTFAFTLDGGPRQGVELLENLTADQLALAGDTDTADEIRLSGRILLAEDGEDNQDLLSTHLRRAGADVVIAGNGRLAVESAMSAAEPFDLILMDMQMPELDGYGATRRLRSAGMDLPIIALTANAMAEDRVRCLEAGCTDYLSKPISRLVLLSTVARYLQDARRKAIPQEEVPVARIKSTHATDGKIAKLVERFVSRLPERVATIESLLRKNSLAELRHALHQLKGAGGGYGFSSISDMAGKAEEDIRQEASIEQVRKQVEELLTTVRQVDGYDPTREQSPSENGQLPHAA